MKVLHVVASLEVRAGGPARSVLHLADGLRGQGVDVLVAAAGGPAGSAAVRLAHLTAPWQVPTPASGRRLARAIRAVHLVEIHGLWNGTVSLAAYLCRRAGVPYILAPRGVLDPICLAHHGGRKRIYRWAIEEATLGGAAGLHFLSMEERDRAQVGRPLRSDEVAVAANAAVPAPPVSPDAIATRLPALRERPVVLHLGRIDAIKGLDLQLEALALIPARDRPTLLIVGPDYGDKERLQAIARRADLDPWIVWAGEVYGDDRFSLLASADLVTLSSVYDCNPVVLTEALSVGAAVLATDNCGGVAAAASRGALFPVGRSAMDFARSIQSLLGSPDRLRQARRRARTYAETDLQPALLLEPLLRLYERVAGREIARAVARIA